MTALSQWNDGINSLPLHHHPTATAVVLKLPTTARTIVYTTKHSDSQHVNYKSNSSVGKKNKNKVTKNCFCKKKENTGFCR